MYMEWVPITEAKPKDYARLIVTLSTQEGNTVCEGFYLHGIFKFIDNNRFKEFYDPVIAWMHMPEPYKN